MVVKLWPVMELKEGPNTGLFLLNKAHPRFPFTPCMKRYIQKLPGLNMGKSGKADRPRGEE